MEPSIRRVLVALDLSVRDERLYIHDEFRVDANPEGALQPDQVIAAVQRVVLGAFSAPPENADLYHRLQTSEARYVNMKQISLSDVGDTILRTIRLIDCLIQRVVSPGNLVPIVKTLSENAPANTHSYDFLLGEIERSFMVQETAESQWDEATPSFWEELDRWMRNNGQSNNAPWKREIIRIFYELRKCSRSFSRMAAAKTDVALNFNTPPIAIEDRIDRIQRMHNAKPNSVLKAIEPLNHVRQALYIERRLIDSLISLSDSIIQLATVEETGRAHGYELTVFNDDLEAPNTTTFQFRPQNSNPTLVELGFQVRVGRACKKIIQDGVGRGPGADRWVYSIFEMLMDAEEAGEVTASFNEGLRAQMLYSEILQIYNDRRKHFSLYVDHFEQLLHDQTHFYSDADGFRTFHRHRYLAHLARILLHADSETRELAFSVRFKELKNIAEIIKGGLTALSAEFLTDNIPKLYTKIFKGIETAAKNSLRPTQVMRSLKDVYLLSVDVPGLPRGKGMGYNLPTADEFSTYFADIVTFWAVGALPRIAYIYQTVLMERDGKKSPVIDRKSSEGVEGVATAESLVQEDLSEEQSTVLSAGHSTISMAGIEQPEKRPEAEQDHSSGDPETSGDPEIVNSMARLTLSPTSQSTGKKVNLRYHMRVTRWFFPRGSEEDPFIADPNYRNIRDPIYELWLRVKHNFARAVDEFLEHGVKNEDTTQLKKRNLSAQIQLVGDIQITKENYSKHERGVFSYSISKKTGRCFHRYFTTATSERIQSEYTQNGHLKIDIEEGEAKQEGSAPSQVPLDDGSYIVRESNTLVTINDPKNHATITLVKMSQFS